MKDAVLVLEDGTVFHGESVGAPGYAVGEVVFNTSMTGYQEILSDPSYARQIVTLTYPHIGNVGVNGEDMEAERPFCSGLVVKDVPRRISNWRATTSLPEFLTERGVTAIARLDTRKLTRMLRDAGAQRGCIAAGEPDMAEALRRAQAFPGLQGMDLAKEVSTAAPLAWDQTPWSLTDGYGVRESVRFRVVAYDFGIKRNILRILAGLGCDLTVVPATTPAEAVLTERPDGVFLSNGPGDPEPCDYAIRAIKTFIAARLPVFGICLGHQLLGLAAGAKTVKMKFGHHGANHPVQELATGRVFISSQNHGFAVDEASLPGTVKATHRSLFDGSLQGIELLDAPAFGFQGHPEASPGPHELGGLFDRFIALMAQARA